MNELTAVSMDSETIAYALIGPELKVVPCCLTYDTVAVTIRFQVFLKLVIIDHIDIWVLLYASLLTTAGRAGTRTGSAL